MQDQLVGDFADFVKYALLRALSRGWRLGVAWYLRPNQANNGGNHIQYLSNPQQWRHLDCELFDRLRSIMRRQQVFGGTRSVNEVQNRNLFRNVVYARELLKSDTLPHQWAQRRGQRVAWFERTLQKIVQYNCDIVFADPDNGLYFTDGFNFGTQDNWKYLPLAEAQRLAEGRTAIFYHQNTQWPRAYGGQPEEIRWCMERLPGCNYAFYSPYQGRQRTFFIVNPDSQTVARLIRFADRWRMHGELIFQG